MQLDPILIYASALVVVAVMAESTTHKLRYPHWFRTQLEAYELFPAGLVPAMVRGVPVLEALLALMLLLPATRVAGGLACAVLMALYGLAIAVNLWRGRSDMDCGCAGPNQPQPLRPILLLRNLVLIGLALTAAATPVVRELGLFDLFVVIATALSLLFIYAAFNALLANAPLLNKLIGR